MYRSLFFYANVIENKNEVLNKVKLKVHLFVSLSREFSKYIKTFAAGFSLVQTVLHDVFAGVQSETIWFKIENVSEEKNVSVSKKFSKILWKTESKFHV